MIVGLPWSYLDTDVWGFVGISLVILSGGKEPTPLQFQTNQNHNQNCQLNPHKWISLRP